MFPFNLFPYTNFHELNLDWILSKLKTAVYTVNRTSPDENGNVNLPTVAGVSSVNGVGADGNGNVQIGPTNIGAVATVNNFGPDSYGNVYLDAVKVHAVAKVANISPDSAGNVPLTALNVGAVATVNGIYPDANGDAKISELESRVLTLGVGISGPAWTQYAFKRGKIASINMSGVNAVNTPLTSGDTIATGAYPANADCNWLLVLVDYNNPPALAGIDENGNIKLISWNTIPANSQFMVIGTYLTKD